MSRLAQLVASLDEGALVALSNRGLVGRARKDLEGGDVQVGERTADEIEVRTGGQVVRIREPLARSTCSCPARSLCRHILTALLFLQAASAPPAAVFEPEEILSLDLQGWAGKKLLSSALELLGRGYEAVFEGGEKPGEALRLRLPSHSLECRWIPGGGLDGMLCSCHSDRPCLHRMACLVAFQAERGVRTLAAAPSELKASAEAPRTREEVLESLGRVLSELVGVGFARLTEAACGRVATLAMSARGVDLPRLERALRSLSQEMTRMLRRDGRSSAAALLGTAAQCEALRTALAASPAPHLVGSHRRRYDPVPGTLELLGAGARVFRTRSGYQGLTVYFWEPSTGRWCTWSEARPPGSGGGFSPTARFREPGPWSGCPSPAVASTSRLQLHGAFRSSEGRLSGRPATQAMVLGTTPLERLEGLSDWSELSARAVRLFGGGLAETSERDFLVRLAPVHWGEPSFDAGEQTLSCPVLDSSGRVLLLELVHSPEAEPALRALESLDRTSCPAVLGRLGWGGEGLMVEPIAVHRPEGIASLGLGSPAEEEDEEESPGLDPQAGTESRLGQELSLLALGLEELAEAGLGSGCSREVLARSARAVEQVGLRVLGPALERLVEARGSPRDLLCAYYLVRIARIQDRLAGG